MQSEQLKQAAAQAALEFIPQHAILGIGTGSTVNHFIDALAPIRDQIKGVVSSSRASTERLAALGFEIYNLNDVQELACYIDGADEITPAGHMIKGGGAALTQEKIVAAVAKQFICIADISKYVEQLGHFPLPIEVLPMARSYVARELVKLGADPAYRTGVVTDNGGVILDVHHLDLTDPLAMELRLNQIAGIISHGIFAQRAADIFLIAHSDGVQKTIK
jgi:ribose 5-phosphate isomerase A